MAHLALLNVVLVYIFWRVVQRLSRASPLDAVAGPPSSSWLKGNWQEIFNASSGLQYILDLVEQYGSIVKIRGMFGAKQLFVADPSALHRIVLRDQEIFPETDAFLKGNSLTLGMGLMATAGEHHKRQRKLLNSVFSVKHMKDLVPTFYEVSYQLRDTLLTHIQSTPAIKRNAAEIDMFDWMARGALEYIGQGGLGHSFDSFDLAVSDEYSKALKDFIPTVFRLSFLRPYIPILIQLGSSRFRRWIVDRMPFSAVQDLKHIADTFESQASAILSQKRAAFQQGDSAVAELAGKGKDVMSVLIQANSDAPVEDRLPENELLGQMTTLLVAHETMSSAMARIFLLLSENASVQEKLRAEIHDARATSGDLSYDAIMALPYLDAICRETLRLFPPVAFLARTAKETTSLPLAYPVTSCHPSGAPLSEVTVEAGTTVHIAIAAVNRLKEVWGDDADQWKPERWLRPLPDSVVDARVPGIYGPTLSFLGGSRACIGAKFAQLEMKMIIMTLLETFRFVPSKQQVVWRLGTVVTPSVKGRNEFTPYMPIVATPIV